MYRFKLKNLRKCIKKAIRFIICFQLIYAQSLFALSVADPNGGVPVVTQSQLNDLYYDQPNNSQFQKSLSDVQDLAEAVADRNIERLEALDAIDPNLLTSQGLRIFEKGKVESEFLFVERGKRSSQSIKVTNVKYLIKNGELNIQGYQNSTLVVEQFFKGIEVTSVISDKDIAVFTTSTGRAYALDSGYFINRPFQDVLPAINVLNTQVESGEVNYDLKFITPGMDPRELAKIEEKVSPTSKNIARDGRGNPLFFSGDILVFDKESGSFLFSLSRGAVIDQLRLGIRALVKMALSFDLDNIESSFSEKFKSAVNVDTKLPALSPSGHVQAQDQTSQNAEDVQRLVGKITQGDPEQLDALEMYLRTLGRSATQSMALREYKLKSKGSNPRQAQTIDQWFTVFEKVKEQALKEEQVLSEYINQLESKKRQSKSSKIKVEELKKKLIVLQSKIESNNFSRDTNELGPDYDISYQELLIAYMDKTVTFQKEMTPWYQQVWKSIGGFKGYAKQISVWTAGGSALYFGGFKVFAPDLAMQIATFAQGALSKLVPNVILQRDMLQAHFDGASYMYPLAFGFISLVAWIPIAHIIGMMIVPGIRTLAYTVGSTSSSIKDKLLAVANRLEPLSTWRKITTFVCVPYAYLLYSVLNYSATLTRQDFMNSLRDGVNPFRRFKGSDGYGQSLGLKANEQVTAGFMNPFLSLTEGRKTQNQMSRARSQYAKDRQVVSAMSAQLALALASRETNIDMATLIGLLNGQYQLESIEEIKNDSHRYRDWKLKATAINKMMWEVIQNSESVDLNKLDLKIVQEVYDKAIQINKKVESFSSYRKNMNSLNADFKALGKSVIVGLANWTHGEHVFLRNIVTNDFVARQTYWEFFSDHITMAILNSFYTVRADPNNPEKMAYSPEGAPIHYMNMAQNTLVHLVMAGPKRALVYQILKEAAETAYAPLENYLLRPASNSEGLVKGAISLIGNTFNPSTNMGGYFIKDWVKSWATIQAYYITSVFFRSTVGNMELTDALSASTYYFSISVWFAFVWTVISAAMSQDEARIGKLFRPVKDAYLSFAESHRLKDAEGIKINGQKIAEQLGKNFGANIFMKSLVSAGEVSAVTAPIRKPFITASYKRIQGTENEPYVLYQILLANKEINLGKESWRQRLTAVHQSFKLQNFETLKASFNESQFYTLMNDHLIVSPTKSNVANPIVYQATLWIFGAALSTHLASVFMDHSFDPASLTASEIGLNFAEVAAFQMVVYALFSSYLWDRVYMPNINSVVGSVKSRANRIKRGFLDRMSYDPVRGGTMCSALFRK